ncbi:MAG: hypothetical protein LLG45_03855 [Actinomycetia bacterium]|nr:hypothetical protein [Actinomycetes bacterium]
MQVVWIEQPHLEPCRGHGVNFLTSDDLPSSANLLAKHEGLEWLTDLPAAVEVFIRAPDGRYSAASLGRLRPEIEAFLGHPWELTGGRDRFKGWASPDLYVAMNG